MAEAGTGTGSTNEGVLTNNSASGSNSKNSSSLSVNSSDSPSVVENDSFLFFSYLDEIEDRIENLRRHAIALSQEKSSLLLVLSQLKEESMTAALKKDEFQDICVNMDRLRTRCNAVDIKVETIRSPEQLEAYTKVCTLVEDLEDSLTATDDKPNVIKRAKAYLNACSSDATESGAIDFKFQGMILDCVMEDQKLFRYRLENIVMNSIRSVDPSTRPKSSDSAESDGGQSESCIKPSAISSAVKRNPDFEEFCDALSAEEKVNENYGTGNDSERNSVVTSLDNS